MSARVNEQDNGGWTPLCEAVYQAADFRIISQLLAHQANPNLATGAGDNALSLAQRQDKPGLIALLLQHGAKKKKPDPRTFVPAIAALLGVRVSYNGQDALMRRFGDGMHKTGGHSGGMVHWRTRRPSGHIDTDGFNYNQEGLVLESLCWALSSAGYRDVPFVRQLPRKAGWLGVVYPGMTATQVSKLTVGRVPAPRKSGNVWTWRAKGFIRPHSSNYDVYTSWTAERSFQNGRLASIEVACDGRLLAP